MLKDTKSLGNNKAPACESRGFVLKKEGGLFDTPSFLWQTASDDLPKNSYLCGLNQLIIKRII